MQPLRFIRLLPVHHLRCAGGVRLLQRNDVHRRATGRNRAGRRPCQEAACRSPEELRLRRPLMCFSGGKDSTYTLMLAVKKYGLELLALPLDNGYIAAESFDNMRRITDLLGVERRLASCAPPPPICGPLSAPSALHAIYRPRTLLRISAICNSCITMVNTIALQMAVEKNALYYRRIHPGSDSRQKAYCLSTTTPFWKRAAKPRCGICSSMRAVDRRLLPSARCAGQIGGSLANQYQSLMSGECHRGAYFAGGKKLDWVAPKDVDGCSSNCRLNSFNNQVHEMVFDYSPYELELSHWCAGIALLATRLSASSTTAGPNNLPRLRRSSASRCRILLCCAKHTKQP